MVTGEKTGVYPQNDPHLCLLHPWRLGPGSRRLPLRLINAVDCTREHCRAACVGPGSAARLPELLSLAQSGRWLGASRRPGVEHGRLHPPAGCWHQLNIKAERVHEGGRWSLQIASNAAAKLAFPGEPAGGKNEGWL